MLRVTVVIPTYNRGALLVRALRSVLDQTRAADEIIVVDDGSTDETAEAVSDMPVRLVRQANAGAAAARNRGVGEAASRWVAFLDSDDLWDVAHLAVLTEAIERTAGRAVLYFTDAVRPPQLQPRRVWEAQGFPVVDEFELIDDGAAWVLGCKQPMVTPACVVSTIAFAAAGGFDPRLPSREDTDLFLKLGIGQGVCAVAGGPAIITEDDSSGARLTALHGSASRSWWESTVRLYQHALANPRLAPDRRAALRAELSEGHWRLARHLIREGSAAEGVAHAARGLRLAPIAFLTRRSSRVTYRRSS